MLKVDGIISGYGKAPALHGVSLSVETGRFVTLIGGNGAGKSTTLRTISGLLRASSGRITFLDEDITTASPRRILEMGIAHCPEGRRVFSSMTVQENLEMGAYHRRDSKCIQKDLDALLARFEVLARKRKAAAGTLSGGEQQLLAVGRAVMARPKLVVFDEPSLGLAPNNVQLIFSFITEINRSGITVLMVEQNAFAALKMCDESFLLESGNVTLSGPREDMINNPYVRHAYLGIEREAA